MLNINSESLSLSYLVRVVLQVLASRSPIRNSANSGFSAWTGLSRLSGHEIDGGIMLAIKRTSYLIILGGVLVAISATMPWVSGFGIITADLPGTASGIVLVLGVVIGLLGASALGGRASTAALVFLWILAVVDGLAVVGLFEGLENDNDLDSGIVQPAVGFWCAVAGVIISIVGTFALQVNRGRAKRAAAVQAWGTSPAPQHAPQQAPMPSRIPMPHQVQQPVPAQNAAATPQRSPDGNYWWDGQTWRPIAPVHVAGPDPSAPRSSDGRYWWDGQNWQPLRTEAVQAALASAVAATTAVDPAVATADPYTPRSPDGNYWWDGRSWQRLSP